MDKEVVIERMEKIYFNKEVSNLEKDYGLLEFITPGCGIDKYQFVKEFALKNNFSKIVDIGCAFGWQSELFLNEKVDYQGIDMWVTNEEQHNKETFEYVNAQYPNVRINKESGVLGVSVLCLGWQCFLYKDDTLNKQFEALRKDFYYSLIYLSNGQIEKVKHLFSAVNYVGDGFYFLES